MSKLFKLTFLLLVLLLLYSTSVSAVHTPAHKSNKTNELILPAQKLTIDDIINLKRKEIELKLGTKLKFKERFALMLVRKKVKRAKKKGLYSEQFEGALAYEETQNHGFEGFLIGFIFSLIGLLLFGGPLLWIFGIIAVYTGYKKGDSARKWVWVGFLAPYVIGLILLAIFWK
jgi:hypothetical protein